ncbi:MULTISPECIES: ATPase [unclassified Sphingomonas]|uniref:F0F1 ATP synthase subunit B family protein n=1 Tax=unclassified Sphingomonas TaxID=196159 RepID=UPI0006FABBE6|nr:MULTISPECIES: ATPase [unclassified Sphingomonas]KQM98316.1 ATPase [Sphingomonas sp. Leaf25]KQN37488.1 ATPase [Sphingomonas sp. Leaf42]KQT27856.1 ATPase [Sphingomonas sp. Leaf407]
MPQIEQLAATWGSQVFWLVLTFGIVFLVVGLGMVPKVQGTVDQRDKGIAADLAAADAARAQADATEAAWRTRENASREAAQKLLADARARGAAATAERLAVANAEVQARVTQAEADIAAQKTSALAEIEGVAVGAAQAIAERVAGVQVSEQDAQRAVKAVLHG